MLPMGLWLVRIFTESGEELSEAIRNHGHYNRTRTTYADYTHPNSHNNTQRRSSPRPHDKNRWNPKASATSVTPMDTDLCQHET